MGSLLLLLLLLCNLNDSKTQTYISSHLTIWNILFKRLKAERLVPLNTFLPTNGYVVFPVPIQLKQQSELHPNPSGGTNPQLPPGEARRNY
jgi:hypothetical protein